MRSLCFFLLLFLALSVLWPVFPESVNAQENGSSATQPTLVTIWIGVIDIPDVDEPIETFDLDAYLNLTWNDKSAYEYIKQNRTLSADGKYRSDSAAAALCGLDEIGWANILQFTNQVGQREILNASLWIDTEGNVTYDERFQATFRSDYKLRAFPFDSQEFHLEIETFNLDNTKVVFEASKETIIFYESPKVQKEHTNIINLEEWEANSEIKCFVGEYTSKMSGRSYSYVSIDIISQRKFGFHVWKIFLPLILIIAISWSVFWIGKEAVASRLSISSIGFLTAISFGFFVTNSLPRISYLTFMDTFIIGVYFLMSLTVLEVLSTYFLAKQGRELVAGKIDMYARWLFPLCLVVYSFALAWMLC